MRHRVVPLNPDRPLQAYVVGLAIGDGNLSNPNGRAVRLRITCDTKYPALIEKIRSSLEALLPKNRVSIIGSKGNFVNVSVYSNHLELLLGWKATGGSKHKQQICIPEWISSDPALTIPCLRGLIETDGSVYRDGGYMRVIFSTVISKLACQVQTMITGLGFQPRLYCVPQGPPGRSVKYQVRLSRNTSSFLELVQPLKA